MSDPGGPLDILNFIEGYETFAVIGHEEPDGDCLASQLVLAGLLRRLGKAATCYSPGPFLRSEIQDLKHEFSGERLDKPEAVIVVDCSTPQRIGRYATEIAQLPTAVIDHHSAGTPFGEVRYIDSRAPSVTLLILKLIETAGEEPTKAEAELLLFGLCTDTGFFRHLEHGSQDVFAASGRLIAAGASPRGTFLRMFGNRTYESRKLLGRLLERTEQRYGGRLLVTWETAEELAEFGKQHRDSDAVYQQLQMVRGCDIVVFVRQESAERCSVGLRSTGAVDVGKMATHFGGGGHRNASGYERPGQVTEVAAEIIDYLGPMLL